MKIVVLKGADDAVPLPHALRAAGTSTRAAGAVAVAADDTSAWALLNVSPAVADQLATDARLLEHAGLSDAPVRAVVLTSARIDHVTGLLGLRDGPPVHLYATPSVFEELTLSLPVLPLLQHYCGVQWHVIPVAGECGAAEFRVAGLPTLEFSAIATYGELPPHAARRYSPGGGETVALAVRDTTTGQRFFCTESLAHVGEAALAWMREADCVLVCDDATEAPSGTSLRADLLDLLADTRANRKLLLRALHEPVAAGADRLRQSELARRGIEIARDRMALQL